MKTSRFFALMLCLLLFCGAVFGAAALRAEASAYLDEDLIGEAYADAIGSMSARGVLNGFPDGSFQPQSGLTREQSAKIIAYLIVGLFSVICLYPLLLTVTVSLTPEDVIDRDGFRLIPASFS